MQRVSTDPTSKAFLSGEVGSLCYKETAVPAIAMSRVCPKPYRQVAASPVLKAFNYFTMIAKSFFILVSFILSFFFFLPGLSSSPPALSPPPHSRVILF